MQIKLRKWQADGIRQWTLAIKIGQFALGMRFATGQESI